MKNKFVFIVFFAIQIFISLVLTGQVNNIYVDDFTYNDGSKDQITQDLTRIYETAISNNLPSGYKLLMRRSIAKLEYHRQNEEELTNGNPKRVYEKARFVIFGSVRPITTNASEIIKEYKVNIEFVNIESGEVKVDEITLKEDNFKFNSENRQILKSSMDAIFGRKDENNSGFKSGNSFNIMILPFENLDDCLKRDICLERTIVNRFSSFKESDNLNIEAKFFDKYEKPSSFSDARKIGKANNADIIIWGDYVESCDDTSSACLKFAIIDDLSPTIPGSGEESEKFMNAFDIKNGYLQKKTDFVIFWSIARSKYDESDFKGALKYYEMINTNGELIREIETMKVYCLLRLNRIEEAQVIFNQIKSISNKASDFYKSGRLHLRKRDFQSAINEFTKAIELDKNFAVAYLYRGDAYYYIGNTQRALHDYESTYYLKPYISILARKEQRTSVFSESTFKKSTFDNSIMRHSYKGNSFDSCTFNNSNFAFSNLKGYKFYNGNDFNSSILNFCAYDKSTVWPKKIDPTSRGAITIDSVINASIKRAENLYQDSIIFFEEIREIYYALSLHYIQEEMPTEALLYVSKARSIPELPNVLDRNIFDDDLLELDINILQALGFQKYQEGSFESSIKYLSKIINMKTAGQNIDSYVLFNAAGILGHCYRQLSQLDSAIFYYFLAIDEFRKLPLYTKGDMINGGIILQFSPFIQILSKIKDYDKLEKTLSILINSIEEICQNDKNDLKKYQEEYSLLCFNLGITKSNIAGIFLKTKQYLKSIFYLDEAIVFFYKSGLEESKEQLCYNLNVKAVNLFEMGNHSSIVDVVAKNINLSIENSTFSCGCNSLDLLDKVDDKFIDRKASKLFEKYRGRYCN
ncbi:MAG: tetratricopeptide repeat protein [Haliscomenobacter sp.]|uniref:tetratricopeptide repeat protein n=1 Tax=Haliscomenobacter sp. TaxID=2717303 RepID=UPI0029BB31E4|nr:tetratricopeptide repeat protein [Haliscomenobacter sp.]MDX2070160.1 tetratricopeptide repeat protein [Haliscomenobacter sp.]